MLQLNFHENSKVTWLPISLDQRSRIVNGFCKDAVRYKVTATGYRCKWLEQRPMWSWCNWLHTGCCSEAVWGVYIHLTGYSYVGPHDWNSYSEYDPCISKAKQALTIATCKGQYLRASLSSVLPAPCNYSKLSISNASRVSQLPSLRFVALPHRIFLSYIFFWNMAEAWELSRLGNLWVSVIVRFDLVVNF
jgi:hypothetical protein